MILMELIDGGEVHRLATSTYSLTHKWRRGFVNSGMGSIGWSLPQRFGGLVNPVYGSVALSIDVLPSWPPGIRYKANFYYAKTSEEDRMLLFSCYLHLQSLARSRGAVYGCFAPTKDNSKIDSTGWASINNNTLVSVIEGLCGADYLALPVDSKYARNSSPNVNYTFTSSMAVLDFISNLCSFYNHLSYIEDDVLHLVSMFTDNGGTIDLNTSITGSELLEFSPVSEISVTNGSDWDIVVTENPYGRPISITPYHDTEANALVELNLAKSIIEGRSARVTLPLSRIPSIPKPGQPVHWIDYSFGDGIEATIRARDVQVNFRDESIRIIGNGDIGAAPARAVGVIPISTGEPWSQIIDNGDDGYSETGTWTTSTSYPGYYGVDYRYASTPTDNDGTTASWTFTLPSTGNYEILVQWAYHATERPTDVPYEIKDGTTVIDTVDVNQQNDPNGFFSLGVANFSTKTCVVTVSDQATDGTYFCADAVKVIESSEEATLPASKSYTLVQEETVPYLTWREQIGDQSDRIWAACAFTAAESTTIERVQLHLKAEGSPTQKITVEIWTDNGSASPNDAPASLVSAATSELDASTLTTAYEWCTFDGISAAITSGTKYWIVVKASAVDGTNYVFWELGNSGTVNRLVKGTPAPVWVDEGDYTGMYKLYKETSGGSSSAFPYTFPVDLD